MTVVIGMEWPDVELGPLCPGEWVEEADLESLPGETVPSEEWFLVAADRLEVHGGWEGTSGVYGNPPDLVGWDAIDERLSLEMAKARKAKCQDAREQWATDKVAKTFFEVRTQADLDKAFALLSHTEERHHVARSIIQMAVDRVVRLERKARQSYLDNLRELNRQMAEWARSVSYRVRLTGEQEPVAQRPRNQAWCLVELRPGIGQVCRGKDAGDKPVVMAEPEIFAFAAARMA